MTRLSVNVNKIALLRNQRNINIPSVIWAANVAVEAGAAGITVHPRPDQRHIRYSDVYELNEILTVEFNIEGNPFTGKYIEIVTDVKPTQATLVPDEPAAVTSDHGWNLNKENSAKLKPVIKKLKKLGIRVSLFVDPDPDTIKAAAHVGTDRVELYTEPYATAFCKNIDLEKTIEKYANAADTAGRLGLEINAGHDLSLKNLAHFCKNVKDIKEVSIGHALIAEALEAGLYTTVRNYCRVLEICQSTKD